ncbi:MAG: CoA-binding protein [Candidatus Actinomarina sp.]|nr:CoA-binding protein [Candidatus Actinomarina sp.]
MIDLLKDKNNSIALIGASTNKDKFGYKILVDLDSKGHVVIPINNKETEIVGKKVFKNVNEIPDCPSIINFVVPPHIGFEITKDLVESGYDNFWYQPGAESDEISEYLDSKNKNYIDDKCIMVVSNLIDKY